MTKTKIDTKHPLMDKRQDKQSDEQQLRAGEATNAALEAIWTAAWFAVNELHCSKAEFIATVTKAANAAFDSQMQNAGVRVRRHAED